MSFTPPLNWHSRPSPNKSKRTKPVTAIVLHADASSRVDSTLDWIRRKESKVSYHVLIGRNGNIYSIVHPDEKAWHAGESSFHGVEDCNAYTIGVSLSNRNDGIEAYPDAQLSAAAGVCAVLCEHYRIPVDRITTHAVIAPKRKTDPKGLDLHAFQAAVAKRMAAP